MYSNFDKKYITLVWKQCTSFELDTLDQQDLRVHNDDKKKTTLDVLDRLDFLLDTSYYYFIQISFEEIDHI